jgi:fatty-acyl-CoA synthase
MLNGRMMDFPLTLTHLLDRANTLFPKGEIVSRKADGSVHRCTYAAFHKRTCQLAGALARLGVKPGDRVATLAWNHSRHLEIYFAVPTSGAVLHTLNLRLHPSDLAYIARHAEDKVVFVDESLLPLLRQFLAQVPSIEHVVVMRDGASSDEFLDYETLIAPENDSFSFPRLDENSAAVLCYTSGTTGNPKGVLFSHRSTVLHTLVTCMADTVAVSEADSILAVVPMFHVNAWGLPFASICTGATIVLPGPKLDPKSLLDLMASEKVTVAAGVPTIWLGILTLLDATPKGWDLSSLRKMLIGGSAAPVSMIDGFAQRHNLDITHAWGMTETSPIGTMARVKRHLQSKDPAAQLALKASQGYPVPFVEQRHTSEAGAVLPWDGATMGELEVRGPWVAASYYGDQGPERFTADGWFKTGDVVTIDGEGYMRICDRSKDVIKSGGEWISSVELENALMSHPAVLEAAVFAGQHPKWDERPIAAVVLKEGKTATKEELAAYLTPRFASFWLPDAYIFVAQIPRTSTGKFLKSKLRELHGNMLMP